MADETLYTLSDVADLAEVTPRTVRYYVRQGLLRSPGMGPGARYDRGHLDRLRLIKRLQRLHLPLAEIRSRLAALTDEEVRALLAAESEAPPGTAVDYIRSVLGGRGLVVRSPTASGLHALRFEDLHADVREAAPLSDPTAATTRRDRPGAVPEPPSELMAEAEAGASDRSTWERIGLSPDIELHVRRPLSRTQNRLLGRLVDFATKLLKEDQP